MSEQEAQEDEWDWHEFNAWCKERWRKHKAKNMEDYLKYIFQMEKLGFTEAPQGAGHRFTHPSGLRIDFWRQSGKWTVVGTNVYTQGPRKMIREVKRLLAESPRENYGDLREDLKEVKRRTTARPYSETDNPSDDPDSPPWEQ